MSELTENLAIILALTLFGSLIISWSGLLFVGMTLAKRLKVFFENSGEFYVPLRPWLFWVSCVCACCMMKNYSKNKRLYPFFRGFDVRSFANNSEIVASYAVFIAALLMLICALFAYGSDLFLGTSIMEYE